MKKAVAVAIVVMVSGLASCGSDDGTVRILLTDSPVAGLERLNVTISKVEVHLVASETDAGTGGQGGNGNGKGNGQADDSAATDDNAWRVVSEDVRTFDMLALRNGVTALLGETDLPQGKVTQVRLITDKVEAVVGGATVPVDCPSCGKTGIKIVTEGALDVSAGKTSEITLDFVAAESLTENGAGGYKMDHVIKVVKQEQK